MANTLDQLPRHQHIARREKALNGEWQCQATECKAKGTIQQLSTIPCKRRSELSDNEFISALIADPRDHSEE